MLTPNKLKQVRNLVTVFGENRRDKAQTPLFITTLIDRLIIE